MSDASGRFALPWLQPGQAQKEQFHNEALATVDIALHPAVESVGTVTPPGSPAIGQAWIVGMSPAGAWSGQAHALAGWTEGGWRFVVPVPGMTVWSVADGLTVRWSGTAWLSGVVPATSLRIGGQQVVGARQPAIAAPGGGGTADAECRAAVAAILSALRTHGLIAP